MKMRTFVFICILLALLLPGCGSSPNTTAPCVKVNGYLYYTSGSMPVDKLPEGYELAGTLERVNYRPRENMTGTVAKGTELYVNPTAPEAVYIRVPDRDGYSLYKLDVLPPTQMPGSSGTGQ